MSNVFITTAIDYPNAVPHIGRRLRKLVPMPTLVFVGFKTMMYFSQWGMMKTLSRLLKALHELAHSGIVSREMGHDLQTVRR